METPIKKIILESDYIKLIIFGCSTCPFTQSNYYGTDLCKLDNKNIEDNEGNKYKHFPYTCKIQYGLEAKIEYE